MPAAITPGSIIRKKRRTSGEALSCGASGGSGRRNIAPPTTSSWKMPATTTAPARIAPATGELPSPRDRDAAGRGDHHHVEHHRAVGGRADRPAAFSVAAITATRPTIAR